MQHPTRAVFVGDGSLLVRCAEAFLEAGHVVVRVASADATVLAWATGQGLPTEVVHATPVLGGDEFDLLFCVGWLHPLPESLLRRARRIALNFHDGPLPRYGGLRAPAWALMEGATRHAITWHEMTPRLDAGRIACTLSFDLSPDETAYSLQAHCHEAGYAGFLRLLDDLARDRLSLTPMAGPPRLYRRADRPARLGTLDWTQPARELDALVRGLDFGPMPNPLALPKMWCHGRLLVVGQALALDARPPAVGHEPDPPGTLVAVQGDAWQVQAAEGVLQVRGLQALDGGPLPSVRVGERLPAPPPAMVERLAQVTPALARGEAAWGRAMAEAVLLEFPFTGRLREVAGPAGHGTTGAEGAPAWQIDLSLAPAARCALDAAGVLAALAAWAAALTGQARITLTCASGDVARACAGVQAYATPWVPVTLAVPAGELAGTLRQAAQAAWRALCEAGPMPRDLPLRLRHPAGVTGPRSWLGMATGDVSAWEDAPDGVPVPPCVVQCDTDGRPQRLNLQVGAWEPPLPQAQALEIASQLQAWLEVFATHTGPLDALSLLTAQDQARLAAMNDTAVPVAFDGGIAAAIERAGLERPQACALVCEAQSLTHEALQARVRTMAARLRQLGLRRGDVVGLCLPRSLDLVATVLAVLRCGAAYLPLDPSYPQDRLRYMRADAQAPWVVGDAQAAQRLGLSPQQVWQPSDLLADAEVACPPDDPAQVGPADLAYLIYTSGSTGRPKGVEVTQAQVVNFFAGMDARVPHAGGGRWLAVTSLSFDISVLELLWTLSRGFTVMLQPEGADAAAASPSAPSAGPAFSLAYFAQGGDAGAAPYRLLLEGAKFADRHGFTAVWTPERHFHAFGGPYPNPAVTSAALATVTERVQLRAGSCVLPLHHPLRLAEDWALVDNLSKGRVGISFAAGWQPQDFVLAPEAFEGRKRQMFQGIATLRRLWRGERLPWPGPDGQPVQVGILPRPVQPELPAWVTVAGNPDTFAEAGQAGCHVLTHLLGQGVDDLAGKIRLFHEAWRDAGHPGRGQVAVMVHAFVAPDDAQASAVAREPLKAYLRTAMDLIRRADWTFPTFAAAEGQSGNAGRQALKSQPLSEADTEAVLDHAFERYWQGSALIGSPARCLALVRRLQAAGADEIACLIDFGIEADTVLAHLPALRDLMVQAGGADVASASAPVQAPASAPGPLSVASHMLRHRITHLQCTPSLAMVLVADAQGRAALSRLQAMLVGGEALPMALARELRAQVPGRLLNMYGPTETTVWSTTCTLERLDEGVSLGLPIANTVLSVRTPWGMECPAGVPGELWIGGAGVSRGYRERPELTAERFVEDARRPGLRWYRTGDRIRRHPDGRLEFLGRLDHQVKVRGHRIELGEIENLLARQSGVREAVVVVVPDAQGQPQLRAVVTPRDAGHAPDPAALARALASQLPPVMQPASIVWQDQLPRTPNGKIDRTALVEALAAGVRAPDPPPAEEAGAPTTAGCGKVGAGSLAEAAAADPVKASDAVCRIWQEVLGRPIADRRANFFDLGGHSLAVVQVQRRLREAIGIEIGMVDMFRLTTIDAIARHLAQTAAVAPVPVAQGHDRAQARQAARALARQPARPAG